MSPGLKTRMLDGKWKVTLLASFLGSLVAIGCMLTYETEPVFDWVGIVSAVCLMTSGIGTWITRKP
jgi:hypothetical protein